jgi:hypothetical protein
MTTKTAQKFTPDQIDTAKQTDLLALAGQHTTLRKCAANEYEGPCPKCGGENRFHVHAREQWFFCRAGTCHPKRGDAIEFVRWMDGLSFTEAVERLLGVLPPRGAIEGRLAYDARRPKQQPAPHTPSTPAADFATRCKGKVRAAAELLQRGAAGQPGRDYLLGRGLAPDTWQAFRLGYAPNVKVPDSDHFAPAIAIPWYDAGGELVAIRYRFLQAHGAQKITSEPGSTTSARLFGWQGMPDGCAEPLPEGHTPIERKFTLLICEGELNAMSAWQAARDTRLDVLSIGSESSRLSDETIAYAGRYGSVLLWTDKESIARQLAAMLPNVQAVASPNGQDANDLHKQGKLGGFLAAWRMGTTRNDGERTALYWNLWDAANRHGLDAITAAVCNRFGAKLGRSTLLGGAA